MAETARKYGRTTYCEDRHEGKFRLSKYGSAWGQVIGSLVLWYKRFGIFDSMRLANGVSERPYLVENIELPRHWNATKRLYEEYVQLA